MRVLICPDKFAGTLSATEVAKSIADGWAAVRPEDDLQLIPLADGGPGFLDAMYGGLGGILHDTLVRDPLGRTVTAQWLEVGDTAYTESAQACGLALLEPDERDPSRTTTTGVGQLIDAAADLPRIVVGLGGSATNDGGRGAVEVLGREIPGMIIATDVDCPLLGPQGATYGFARQKGAAVADLPVLEERMRMWAAQAPELIDEPGAGAAGGLGFGLMMLGGRRVSGAGLVMDVLGVPEACAHADLVITGEGRFDWQSLQGKVVGSVLGMAGQAVVIAGAVDLEDPPVPAYSLVDAVGADRAMSDTAEALAEVAAGVAAGFDDPHG